MTIENINSNLQVRHDGRQANDELRPVQMICSFTRVCGGFGSDRSRSHACALHRLGRGEGSVIFERERCRLGNGRVFNAATSDADEKFARGLTRRSFRQNTRDSAIDRAKSSLNRRHGRAWRADSDDRLRRHPGRWWNADRRYYRRTSSPSPLPLENFNVREARTSGTARLPGRGQRRNRRRPGPLDLDYSEDSRLRST
jgi:hypothetical protein